MAKGSVTKISVAKILEMLEERAPESTAESWDNVGLLAGSRSTQGTGAIVAIDLTREVLERAIAKKASVIVNHHPCIFPKQKGLARVTAGAPDALQSIIYDAIQADIAIVACHTNFDVCALEVVDLFSKAFSLKPEGRLIDDSRGILKKLVTFVPESHLDLVREAVSNAGAGVIGNYDHCGFAVEGLGSFRGLDGTKPFIGKSNRLEMTKEIRFETVYPKGLEKTVLQALFASHPYEEVAFDIYSLEQNPQFKGVQKGIGYGVYGVLEKEIAFSEFVKKVKKVFGVNGFFCTEPQPKKIKRIAFAAGKGASFVSDAAQKKCEVMITGEAGFHVAADASRKGMAVIELGHRESEIFFPQTMSRWLKELGLSVEIVHTPLQKVL